MALSKITIKKQPAESRIVTMDFNNKMATAEVINSFVSVVSDPAGLTFDNNSYSGQQAQTLVSAGTIPNRTDVNYRDYKVTITVGTDLGQILENDGILRVIED